MNQNEIRLAQRRIVKQRFEQHGVRSRHVEITAAPRAGVKVDGQVQAPGLGGQEAEDVILQVFSARAGAPGLFGLGPRWVADVERAQIDHLEFEGDGAALLLALEGRADHFGEVVVERRRPRSYAAAGIIPPEQAFLQGEKRLLVGVVDQGGIRQRVHERVGERHP